MPKVALYLGVDGGGTKTDAVLIDQNRKILGRGHAAGSNAAAVGPKTALANLTKAIKQAVKSHKNQKLKATLAIGGVDSEKIRNNWQTIIVHHPFLSKLFQEPAQIVNDSVAALRSGTTDTNALVIIAGTGSICYGRNTQGKEAKSGGVGHLLADGGSAYAIGSAILKAVTKSLDGRGPKTSLADLLFAHLKINSLEKLVDTVYQKPWNKTDIAGVAPLAEKAAGQNDQVAIKIITEAADELALMIKSVVQKLDLGNKQYTIVLTGSVLENLKLIQEKLQKQVLKFSPKAKFTKPKIDSATTAAYLALENS